MTIHQKVHQELKALRAIERIIEDPEFIKIYEKSNDKQTVDVIINNKDKSALVDWIKKQSDYSRLTVREIQAIARQLGICYFTRKSKELLIHEITQRKNDTTFAESRN